MPEFIWASNKEYENSPSYGAKSPKNNFTQLFPGQSSLKLQAGSVRFGISTENIWWGPGQFSSLTMSNHAPGFPHLTVHSAKPMKSPLGYFEWQILGGKLIDDPKQSDEIYSLRTYNDIFPFSTGSEKYLNALVLSYQPSFLRNVSLGLTRSFIGTIKNVDSLGANDNKLRALMPVFDDLFKSKLQNEDQREWNQIASIFMRIFLKNSNAEVYWEYGWNDHKYNMRDMLMAPTHSAAYLVGFKKMIRLSDQKWLDITAEVNQMEQSPDYLVRTAGNWYVHWFNTNYTHHGQVLGSGIGYGNNAFTMSTSIRSKNQHVGLLFQKVQHDPNNNRIRWSDYGIGVQGRANIKNGFLFFRCMGVQSVNYAWTQDEDRFNFVGSLGVSYLLK
jgi:hypothetical protein